jgi:hypothetical protein
MGPILRKCNDFSMYGVMTRKQVKTSFGDRLLRRIDLKYTCWASWKIKPQKICFDDD